jgi:hypothetical protein
MSQYQLKSENPEALIQRILAKEETAIDDPHGKDKSKKKPKWMSQHEIEKRNKKLFKENQAEIEAIINQQ